MDFTTEEIKLCKQVAEKHKRKIEYGDWYINFDEEVRLKEFFGDGYREEDCFFLWTISDCLEFLEKEGLDYIFNFKCFPSGDWSFIAEDNRYERRRGEGKTRLEGCLKVVLAVLEEK